MQPATVYTNFSAGALVGRDIESLIGRIGNEELAQVVSALFVAGNYEQARQTAEGIGDPGDKAWALRAVAEATVKMGDPTKAAALIEQARQTAEGIGDPKDKARALKDIARSYARLGHWRQARQIAELNTTDDGRAIALAAILEAWAERRNPALAKVRVEEK